MQRITFAPRNHVGQEKARSYIRHCATLRLPTLGKGAVGPATLYVVGGGPSVANHLDDLRTAQGVVATVNGCHDYLLREGVNVGLCVLADSAEDLADLITDPRPDVVYLVASQCHPRVFERLKDFRVVTWHAWDDRSDDTGLQAAFPGALGIYGGSTAALRCLHIGHVMGFRKFRIYGLDSSFHSDDAYHAYPGALDPSQPAVATVERDGLKRTFKTNIGLVMQAANYLDIIREPWAAECSFELIGDGLLPFISAGNHHLKPAAAA